MLFISYRHWANLKATGLRFSCSIIFQHAVRLQISANCSNVLLPSAWSKQVRLSFSLVWWMQTQSSFYVLTLLN